MDVELEDSRESDLGDDNSAPYVKAIEDSKTKNRDEVVEYVNANNGEEVS